MAHWNLGSPFARSYCVVHDVQQRRLGFADALHEQDAPTVRASMACEAK